MSAILKYNFKIDLSDEDVWGAGDEIRYDILLPALREFQNFIHHAIDARQGEIAKEAQDQLREELTIFRYEDIESEISIQESFLKVIEESQKVEVTKKVNLPAASGGASRAPGELNASLI